MVIFGASDCRHRYLGLIFRDVEAHCSVNHEYHLSLSTAHLDALLREKATLTASMQALEPQVRAAEARVANQTGQRVVWYG